MKKTIVILITLALSFLLLAMICFILPGNILNQSAPSRLKTKTLRNTIVTKRVPAGSTILQGRLVTFPVDFYIGSTEITWMQWHEVAAWATDQERGNKKCRFKEYHGQKGSENKGSERQPVTHVGWRESVDWCNALSEKEGLTPVYIDDGNYNPLIDASANGYRLPTEAEWEYAARYIDGKEWTPEYFLSGATSDYTNEKACNRVAICTNSRNDWGGGGQWISLFDFFHPKTKKVKSRKANALGLYDMSGNVHEWCWDLWTDSIDIGNPAVDPQGPTDGFYRVYRGGSYNRRSPECSVSVRSGTLPYSSRNSIGFRVVRNRS